LGVVNVLQRSLQVMLVVVALAACGAGVDGDGPATTTAEQALQSCPTACESCAEGSFCTPDASGCMRCQAEAPGYCETASDCHDGVPRYCTACPNGSRGCAHWACIASTCTIATCD
jgi:hypothetical protein